MSLNSLSRHGRFVALVAGALMVMPAISEARPGGGKSSGSRGSRTDSAPAPTSTAPNGAQPFQRSATPSAPSPSVAGAGAAAASQAARPSMGRSLMMGLGAGLLGAGLFGMLSGSGFMAGLGSFAGMLGFLLQFALIGGAIWLAIRFFRNRSQPQMAGAGPAGAMAREAYQPQPRPVNMNVMGGGNAAPRATAPVTRPLTLQGEDFNAFEKLLTDINAAYSNEDEAGLRKLTTKEMFGYFDEDLSGNARKGFVDRVSDVKLLQGDLSEAWGEGNLEYATVAMRFSLINALYERASGKVVEGHATIPQEVAEHWTFVRPVGGAWTLSGIQSAA